MKKYMVMGAFFVIFVAGLVVILVRDSVSFSDFMRSLEHLNPRFLSLLLLPFVAVIFVIGVQLRKKREERMWKRALQDTRDKRRR